jgi:hypothetical protein
VAELADAQGCDEADVVWDLAAGMRVPRETSAKRAAVAKRAARAGARPPARKKAA